MRQLLSNKTWKSRCKSVIQTATNIPVATTLAHINWLRNTFMGEIQRSLDADNMPQMVILVDARMGSVFLTSVGGGRKRELQHVSPTQVELFLCEFYEISHIWSRVSLAPFTRQWSKESSAFLLFGLWLNCGRTQC